MPCVSDKHGKALKKIRAQQIKDHESREVLFRLRDSLNSVWLFLKKNPNLAMDYQTLEKLFGGENKKLFAKLFGKGGKYASHSQISEGE